MLNLLRSQYAIGMLVQVRATMFSALLIKVGTVGMSLVPKMSFGATSVIRKSRRIDMMMRVIDSLKEQFSSPNMCLGSLLPASAYLCILCQFQK